MMLVEVPVKNLQAEVAKLARADGPHSQLYAQGAIDALTWILCGNRPPSEGGTKEFPLSTVEATSVH